MCRNFFIAITALALAVSALGQSRRVQPTPTPTPLDETIKISTEEVKLNVLAFDEKGNFFDSVTDRDLVIREDNVLHPPTSVRRLPANVLIVMDTGGELRVVKSLDKTRRVAQAVADGLRPEDSIAIMTYAEKPEMLAEWTTDRKVVVAAIQRSNFGRKSAFVEALTLARTFFERSGVDNRHLVLITDGTDSTASGSAKFDAINALLATDISVHVLSYASLEAGDIAPRTTGLSNQPPPQAMPDSVKDQLPKGGPYEAAHRTRIGPTFNIDRTLIKKLKARKADLEASEKLLEKLSDGTNGEFIDPFSVDEMIDKASLVGRMIDSSYVVTYMPKIPVVPTRGIAERNIEVTSKREGLTVVSKRKVILLASK